MMSAKTTFSKSKLSSSRLKTTLTHKMSTVNRNSPDISEYQKAVISTYKSEILQLQKKVSDLSTTHRFLHDENGSLSSRIKTLETELSETCQKNQLASSKLNWLIDNLKQENSTLQYESNSMKNQLLLANQKLALLQKEKSHLVEKSEKSFNELTCKIQKLQQEKIDNTIATSDLSSTTNNNTNPYEEKLSKCYKLFKDNEDLVNLETDSKLISLLNEETHRLNEKIVFFQDTINSQTSQLYDLNCKITDLKSEKDLLFTLLDSANLEINLDNNNNNETQEDSFYVGTLSSKENSSLANFVKLYNTQAIELSQLKNSNHLLKDTIESYLKVNESLRLNAQNAPSNLLTNKETDVDKLDLEKQLLLAKIKILDDKLLNYSDFMIKTFESTPGIKNQGIEKNNFQKDEISVRLSTLRQVEESLDKYIQQIESSVQDNGGSEGSKKRKLDEPLENRDLSVSGKIYEISQLQSRITEKDVKIAALQSDVQHYKSTISKLNNKLTTRYNEEVLKDTVMIHQPNEKILKLNCQLDPYHKVQQLKKSHIVALRQENEALLNRLDLSAQQPSRYNGIPKEVLQRYIVEMNVVRTELDGARKARDRLRDVYGKRTRDLLDVLNVLFGFIVEPTMHASDLARNINGDNHNVNNYGNMKVKLSRQVRGKSVDEPSKDGKEMINFIIVVDLARLDVSYKATSKNREEAQEFVTKYLEIEQLVDLYVKERKDIAGFLAKLSLKISQYESEK